MAATESPMAEYWLGTDPGIPLADTTRIPGTVTPVNGKIVPSPEPGFGMQIEPDDIREWDAH